MSDLNYEYKRKSFFIFEQLFVNYNLINFNMPFVKVYIHFVWSTKNRVPFLNTKELRNRVWNHIRENGRKKDIFVDFVNGYSDHCHCLVYLAVDQSIQKVMQLIKGESSFWINKQGLTKEKFEWQDEYFAVSVS